MKKILFSNNIYTATVKESRPSDSLLTVVLNKPLTFAYEKTSYRDFSKIYSENNGSTNWIGRKFWAIPVAVYHILLAIKDIVMAILTLPAALFDKNILFRRTFSVVRHAEWAFGATASLISDKYGLYRMQRAEFQLACYSWHGSSSEERLKLGKQCLEEEYSTEPSALKKLEDKKLAEILPYFFNTPLNDLHLVAVLMQRLVSFNWNLLDYQNMSDVQFVRIFFINEDRSGISSLLQTQISSLSKENFEIIMKRFLAKNAVAAVASKYQNAFTRNTPACYIQTLFEKSIIPTKVLSVLFPNPSTKESREKFQQLTAAQVLKILYDLDPLAVIEHIDSEQLKNAAVASKFEQLIKSYRKKLDDNTLDVDTKECINRYDIRMRYPTAQSVTELPDAEFAKVFPFSSVSDDPSITERLKQFDWNAPDYSHLEARQIFTLFFQNARYDLTDNYYPLCESRIALLSKENFQLIVEKFANSEADCVHELLFIRHIPISHFDYLVDIDISKPNRLRNHLDALFAMYASEVAKKKFRQLTDDQLATIFDHLDLKAWRSFISEEQLAQKEMKKKYNDLLDSHKLDDFWLDHFSKLRILGIVPEQGEFRFSRRGFGSTDGTTGGAFSGWHYSPNESRIINEAYERGIKKWSHADRNKSLMIKNYPQIGKEMSSKLLQFQKAEESLRER